MRNSEGKSPDNEMAEILMKCVKTLEPHKHPETSRLSTVITFHFGIAEGTAFPFFNIIKAFLRVL